MSKIISFLNQKGGVGKTTIAINVCRYFTKEKGSAVLVDADPQATARDWHNASGGKYMHVVGMDRPTIDKDIKILKSYDWVFIDGAPRLEQLTLGIINCADYIFIPITPSQSDVWATIDLVNLLKKHMLVKNLKCAFIISMQMPNTKIGKEFRNYLKEFDLPIFESGTFCRISYKNCLPSGTSVIDDITDPKATDEIITLSKAIEEFINDENKIVNDKACA